MEKRNLASTFGHAPKKHRNHKMNTAKKFAIGFGIFMLYFIVARIIENKVSLVRKLTNLGGE